jgi:hypothetical protein
MQGQPVVSIESRGIDMTIAMKRTLLLIAAAFLALAAVIATTSGRGGDQAHAAGPTKTVHVKQASLSQGCGDQSIVGAHFVLNQIAAADQPSSIQVYLSEGTSPITVSRSKSLSSVAHYTVTFPAPTTVVDATAVVPQTWTGQFVLSNYICGPGGSSTPPSSSMPPGSTPPGSGAPGSGVPNA